ncbi:YnfC family lipoprotein [Enterobacter sp. R1(2018)]|uniref:YnfC family lipoprotein n=1 Tax=Enterobacter sp. R1(2018) TaxID=2447891 RepID=UPI000EB0F294|nr:YnfC family lipoprotein [Enterobacter sp. R1(2018)]RKQ38777.1 YnfC family lipoprotein [Enterobacter sp. R1(2018)]
MKKIIILSSLVACLTGCDNNDAPQAFTPEMASFSNEFDFDPLRGPVKDFSQTLMNEKGEVVKRVVGSMSAEGCFDTLEFHDIENNTGAALVLDANYYLDAVSREKRVKLQGKCQLAELPAAAVTYDTDDNGFVVKAHGKDVSVDYLYDTDGYPTGKTTTAKASKFAVMAQTGSDKKKRLDYTSISTLNDKPVGKSTQSCDYDAHFNPVSCALSITDDSVTPPAITRYVIKNTIDYY